MKYIVASIGRSGSTLITDLISRATGQPEEYVQNIGNGEDCVKKTHAHFRSEPSFEYRAVFAYGSVLHSVASMYLGRCNLPLHLEHLEVATDDRLEFWEMMTNSKNEAFRFLVEGDKLRYRENITSWGASEHTLFVKYEDLCEHTDSVIATIVEHTGLRLPSVEIRARVTKASVLPADIRELVETTYRGFGPPDGVALARLHNNGVNHHLMASASDRAALYRNRKG